MSNNQNFIEEINNEILTLFEKQEKKPECLPYLFPKDVKVNPDLLFIGINPSITKQTRGKIKKDNYSIKNIHNQEIINEIKTQDESLRETLPYFNKIQDMVNNNEIEKYECIDLFYERKKTQSELLSISKNNGDSVELSDFGEKQFEITKKVIEKINPKIVVVINALASKIFRNIYNIADNDFDDEIGTYKKKIFNDQETIIFFSGMLSGQHALDNGSFNRLKWHIKQVKKSNCSEKQICLSLKISL